MIKSILSFAILFAGLPLSASAQDSWERFNDVSVVWAKPKGLAKLRFDSAGDYGSETGCAKRKPEIVTVLSQSFYTPNGADDLFRARTASGSVNSYRIPPNDAPRVIFSWLENMVEEGKRVRVSTGLCGNAGFIYVDQIEKVK